MRDGLAPPPLPATRSPEALPHICQVALAARNAAALRQWYVDVFGLAPSGWIAFFPPGTTRVQGIPGAWEKLYWAVDAQDYFQLEFFQFWRPRSRPKPPEWRPCDIGYNMLGLAVGDFDRVLRACGNASGISGPDGDRRAIVTDPEGNLVEILERDPLAAADGSSPGTVRPDIPALARYVRVSVPDLAQARRTFAHALGLAEAPQLRLHTADDEARWGLAGAEAESLVLRAGNFLLELVEYRSPAPRPLPPDYRLSDLGFMNIALGLRDTQSWYRAYARATTRGMTANGKVLDIGIFRVMYVNDPDGFSVELLQARRPFWRLSGFLPSRRSTQAISAGPGG